MFMAISHVLLLNYNRQHCYIFIYCIDASPLNIACKNILRVPLLFYHLFYHTKYKKAQIRSQTLTWGNTHNALELFKMANDAMSSDLGIHTPPQPQEQSTCVCGCIWDTFVIIGWKALCSRACSDSHIRGSISANQLIQINSGTLHTTGQTLIRVDNLLPQPYKRTHKLVEMEEIQPQS